MIGKAQWRLRRYQRHVTIDAVRGHPGFTDGPGPHRCRGVTFHAAAVIEGGRLFARRIVRIVAGEAAQLSLALSKTSALVEVKGLVPDIPGIIPIDFLAGHRRFPVTRSTKLVQLIGRTILRIPYILARGGHRVESPRPVTYFAMDSGLRDPGFARVIERNRTGRMAFEAPSDSHLRIGSRINPPRGLRQRGRPNFGLPRSRTPRGQDR